MIHVSALNIATFLSLRLGDACENTTDGRFVLSAVVITFSLR